MEGSGCPVSTMKHETTITSNTRLKTTISDTKPFIVLYNGEPHDIGPFISDHPGGADILHNIKEGTEISHIMTDASIHVHSSLAFDILRGMKVRNLKQENEGSFLDLTRPLVWQLISPDSKITKLEYLKGIHTPQFLHQSARLFESDILESLTKTTWWVIPIVWLPVSIIGLISGVQYSLNSSLLIHLCIFLLGLGMWSLLEYLTHRFLFHIDMSDYLPDTKLFLVLHFFLHGIHHYMPMDPYRLVMPPVMTIFLGAFFWLLSSIFVRSLWFKLLLFSGLLIGYIRYDLTHYHLHHYEQDFILSRILGDQEALRKKHNSHHYRTPGLGFGVSSSLWDYTFGTMTFQ